ncbi:invasin domain 3-containing protein [Bartonella choladocola]|uniref:Invasin, domain 3 n=1 Tax=Bartonella choladocola TaxID=2750995 RepID=A0A1U9MIK4_9HYPH|nr:Invasin, domain 3 [Bartonella choladocola]
MPADNVSNVVLTLSLKTTQGTPYDADVKDIALTVTGKKTARVDPSFKRVGEGIYEITVTAGKDDETLILTPSVEGQNIASAKVIVAAKAAAHVINVAIVGNETSKVANGTNYFDFKATAQDDEGKAVADATIIWSQDKGDNVVLSVVEGRSSSRAGSLLTRSASEITSTTDEQGVAIIRLTSKKKAVSNIKVSAHVQNSDNIVSANPVSFVAGDMPKDGEGNSTFEAQPASIPADDVATSTLKFTAKDENGNIITGLGGKLRFSLTDKNGSRPQEEKVRLSTVQETPAQSGIYVATLQGTLAGIYTIKPEVSSVAVGALKVQVTLKAALVDANSSEFWVSSKTIKANDAEASIVTFKPKDANGEIITELGNKLKFVVTDKDNREIDTTGRAVNLSKIQESPDGTYKATLKGTLAGTYKITPKVSSVAVGTLNEAVTLTAGEIDTGEGNSSFQFDNQTIVAGQNATLTLVAKDKFGNPIDYDPSQLSFVSSSDGSAIDIGTITKTGAGTYKAVVTGKKIGQYRFVPKKDNNTLAELSATIKVTAGTPVEKDKGGEIRSTFEADQYTIVADGAASSTLTFKAQDFYGNVVAGLGNDLTFDIVDGGGNKPDTNKVVLSEIQESPDGTYTATLKGTLAGTYKITPKVSSVAVGTLNVAVTLTAGKVDGGKGNSSFGADKTPISADGTEQSTLTFKAKDAYGNVVAGLGNELAFDIVDGGGNKPDTNKVILSEIQESPDGTYKATLKGTLVGTYKLKPLVSGAAVGTLEAEVRLTAGNVFAGNSEFSADQASIPANGTEQSTLTFTAKDANQNPVTELGNKLAFDIVDEGGNKPDTNKVVLSEIQETPAQSGIYVATLKGTLAGTYKITPKVSSVAVGTLNEAVTLTAGEIDTGEGNSSFQFDHQTIVAGQNATLTLVAKDKFGNPIDYDPSQLSFVSSSDGSDIDIGTITKAGAGTYKAVVTGKKIGQYRFVPKKDNNTLAELSATIKVTAGTPVEKDKGGEIRSTFEADQYTIVADGAASSTLTFKAQDFYGNVVAGLGNKLAFDIVDGGGNKPDVNKVVLSEIQESPDGTYKATLKGTLAGTYKITPKVSSVAVGTLNVAVTLTAGKVDGGKGNSSFGADKTPISADGTEQSTLTFKAKDAYGNVVAGLGNKLAFDIVDGGGNKPDTNKVILSEIQESPDGTYKATLKGTLVGTYKLKPLVSGAAVGTLEAEVTLTAGNVFAGNSEFRADRESIPANGTEQSTLTFTAKDANQNPVIELGNKLAFDIVDEGGNKPDTNKVVLSEIQETPAQSGIYVATLKGTLAGTYKITPKVSSVAVGTLNEAVTLTAGEIDTGEGNSSFQFDKPAMEAGQNATLTLVAKDKFGNPIDYDPSQLSFVSSSDGSDIDIGTITKTGAGTYKAVVTGKKIGQYRFVPKKDNNTLAELSATISVTAGTPVEKDKGGEIRSTFEADQYTIVADGAASSTLTFKAQDFYGNVVAGLGNKLTFDIVDGGGNKPDTNKVVLSEIQESPDGTYKATLKGTLAGTYKITPKVSSVAVGTLNVAVTLTAGKVDGGKGNSAFIASPTSFNAGDSKGSTLTFTAKDAYGNLVAGLGNDLAFDIVDGGGNKPDTNKVVLSNIQESPDGTYKATLKGTLVGTYKLKPLVSGAAVGTLEAEVTLTAGNVFAGNSEFRADRESIPANGTEQSTLTFTAKDAYGNVVAGLGNKLTFDIVDESNKRPNTNKVILSNIQETPAQSGIYVATLKGTLAGTYKITPKVSSVAVGTLNAAVTLTAGKVDGGKGNSTFIASPTSFKAGDSQGSTLTFTAKDAYGNLVAGLGNDLAFDIVDGGGNKPDVNKVVLSEIQESPAQSGTYKATLQGTLAGTYKITPKVSSVAVGTLEATVAIKGGDVDTGRSTFEVDRNSIPADGTLSSTLTFTAIDVYGNAMSGLATTGSSDKVSFVVTDQNGTTVSTTGSPVYLTSPKETADGSGIYTATLKGAKIGEYIIKPNISNKPVGELKANVTVTVGAANAAKSTFTATPSFFYAGDSKGSKLTFKPMDVNLNPIKGLSGSDVGFTIKDSSSSGNIVVPDGTAFNLTDITETSPGTYEATFTGTKAGNYYYFTSTVLGVDVLTQWVRIYPGAINEGTSEFSISSDSIAAGGSSILTFTARDIYNNPVTDNASNMVFVVTSQNADASKGISLTKIQETPYNSGKYTATVTGMLVGTYTFTPTVSGVAYNLPRQLTVTIGSFSQSNSSLTADNNNPYLDDIVTLTFKPRDLAGNIIVYDPSKLGLKASTLFEFLDATKSENEEGTYLLRFKVLRRGYASLYPTFNGEVINNSFYKFLLFNSNPVKETTKFYMDKDIYRAGDYAYLYISFKDKNGDNIINYDRDIENFVKNQMASVLTSPGSDYIVKYSGDELKIIDGRSYMKLMYQVKKAGTNLTFTLKYPEWQDALSTNAFSITTGTAFASSVKIELDKKEYKVGDDIIVTIHAFDGYGNPTTILSEYSYIDVPNASTTMPRDSRYGVNTTNWKKIDDYTYQVTYKARTPGTNLQLYGYNVFSSLYTYRIGDPFNIVAN